ncbi:MAG: hypothetical protein HQL52_06410 [Magnetococcales bacterium]|nr:hypothetical protein [Magnetococcales bacterium]
MQRFFSPVSAVLFFLCSLGLFPGSAATLPAETFEPLPTFQAVDLLGAEALVGEHYRIEPEVTNDGRMNGYSLTSAIQNLSANGDDRLVESAREIEAIAAIRTVKKTDAYMQSLANAAVMPLTISENILRDPVKTLKDIPAGVGQAWEDLNNAIKNWGKGPEDERDDMAGMKELVGFNSAKRKLAAQLNVDPYTSNPLLQEELTDLTWAQFAGKATVTVAMSVAPIGPAAEIALTTVNATGYVQDVLKEKSPSTLMTMNGEALVKIGMTESEVEDFLLHDHCTPRHQTILVDAMARLEGVTGRDDFIRKTAGATNEISCRQDQRVAEMILAYQEGQARVLSIEILNDVVFFQDENQHQVLPLWADYLPWTQKMAGWMDGFPDSPGTKGKILWTNGQLSPLTQSRLRDLGVEIATLKMPAAASFLPAEPIQILDEILAEDYPDEELDSAPALPSNTENRAMPNLEEEAVAQGVEAQSQGEVAADGSNGVGETAEKPVNFILDLGSSILMENKHGYPDDEEVN